jgi:hypothetical protein
MAASQTRSARVATAAACQAAACPTRRVRCVRTMTAPLALTGSICCRVWFIVMKTYRSSARCQPPQKSRSHSQTWTRWIYRTCRGCMHIRLVCVFRSVACAEGARARPRDVKSVRSSAQVGAASEAGGVYNATTNTLCTCANQVSPASELQKVPAQGLQGTAFLRQRRSIRVQRVGADF